MLILSSQALFLLNSLENLLDHAINKLSTNPQFISAINPSGLYVADKRRVIGA